MGQTMNIGILTGGDDCPGLDHGQGSVQFDTDLLWRFVRSGRGKASYQGKEIGPSRCKK